MTSPGEPRERSLYKSMAIPVKYCGTVSSSGVSSGNEKHPSSLCKSTSNVTEADVSVSPDSWQ